MSSSPPEEEIVETPPVGANEIVRASTPVPATDEDPTPRDAAGNEYPDYDGGFTPKGSPIKVAEPHTDSEAKETPEKEQHEEKEEEQESLEQDKVGSQYPNRNLPANFIESYIANYFNNSSGPLTPEMVKPIKEKRANKLKRVIDSQHCTPIHSTPTSRMDPTESVLTLHREINMILTQSKSYNILNYQDKNRILPDIKENDIRQLVLSMQSQIANLTGNISGFQESMNKLKTQSASTHGHAILQEDACKTGFGKLEDTVRSAWISQGRNRAAIATNNELILQLSKEITIIQGLLRDIIARLPPLHPIGPPKESHNWMTAGAGTSESSQKTFTPDLLMNSLQALFAKQAGASKKPKVQKLEPVSER